MARVLVVTNTPHQPATSGYSQRVTAVIAALQKAGHEIAVVSIKPLVISEIELGSTPVAIFARLRVLSKLLGTPSASLAKWYSPQACDALSAIAANWQPAVVLLESSYLAPYSALFHCPVVFDLHNIESQLIGNYSNDRRGLTQLGARLESRLLCRLEATIPHEAFGVTTVSDTDANTLTKLSQSDTPQAPKRLVNNSIISTVSQNNIARRVASRSETTFSRQSPRPIMAAPNGVNDEAFTIADGLSVATAPTAVFIGHLGWRPNIDGAIWLATKVWPLVTAKIPDAQLQIIGRDPAPAVTALAAANRHISVHGNVPSVFPYLSQAAVATAPLWTAGGTRLKILEALGTGTPVVATSLGALGLENLAASEVLTICDQPQGFADALITQLLAPAKSTAARAAAENFRWSRTLASLVAVIDDAGQ